MNRNHANPAELVMGEPSILVVIVWLHAMTLDTSRAQFTLCWARILSIVHAADIQKDLDFLLTEIQRSALPLSEVSLVDCIALGHHRFCDCHDCKLIRLERATCLTQHDR